MPVAEAICLQLKENCQFRKGISDIGILFFGRFPKRIAETHPLTCAGH
jgi:hypothetical protein